MADVRKTVEIALQVVGVDLKKITQMADAFTGVQKQIEKTTEFVGKLQKTLDSIKAPKSLSQVITSLQQLDKIKAPNLTNIANGFDKLSKMSKPPDISIFVKELQKFQNIKLPGVTALVNGFKKLTELPVKAVVNQIRSLNTALAELDKKGGISAFKNFARDVNQMKTAFSSAASSMNKMKTTLKETGDAAQQSGLQLRTFTDKVKTVLQFRVISAALLGVNDAIRNGLTAIMEYDQALKDLQAITGATSLEVAQMGVKILEVASRTKFSASEVAQGMRTIGQAGFSASEAVETMQAVSDLATGTLSDMKTTVDLVTTAMRVFQIDASQSATVADVFANSVNRSKLTIDKLRTAMNYIGPIARDSGVTFKELAASMGTLANSGLRASTIGTGLRRVFSELIDPSKKLKAAADNAGVALAELDPRSSSLSDVIQNLGLVVNDAQVAFDVFGKRGAAAVLALSGAGSKFQEMLGTIDESGAAANQAAIQMEGLGVSFKNLQDKIGLFAIALGEAGIADVMRGVINASRNLVDVLTLLVGTTFVSFIGKIILVTTAITALGVAFTFVTGKVLLFSKAVGITAVLAFKAISAAVSTTTVTVVGLELALAPILILIGGIAALAGIMFLAFKDGAKGASEEAAILADKYDTLEKKLRDYGKATANMVEGSDALKKANLELRTELLNVAKGNSELSESALQAAEDINPLTGSVKKGSEALNEYNDILNKFQTDKLVLALDEAGKSMDIQTSRIHELINRYKDAFSQIGIYSKAFGNVLIDTLNFDFGNIPSRISEASKEVTGRAEEIKAGVDISQSIRNGTISIEELRDAIKSFDMSNLTSQQDVLVKSYNALNERAIKFAQHQRDIGAISLKGTIESIEQMARDAGLTGLELQAVVLEFERLKKVNADTFSNIIEKWEQDTDPVFLTSLIEGFKELGGVVDISAEKDLKQIESQRQLRIEELNRLKETVAIAKQSGVNMETFWNDYYTKEQKILKTANDNRKTLSENANAQQLLAYGRELVNLEKYLTTARVIYKYDSELRGKEIAKLRAESQARINAIISGSVEIDPKEQTQAYKTNLKERESAHVQYIAAIKTLESNRAITEETAEKRILNARLNFYKISLNKAKEYQNQIDKQIDPDEYFKRQKVVLSAERKFYEEKSRYIKGYSDLKEELEISKIEKTATISESIYKSALDTQKNAQKTLNTELKAAYDTDVYNIEQYYAKKKELAFKDEIEKSELIKQRIKTISEEFDKRIEAENSILEKEELRGQKISNLSKLQSELDKIEQQRIQTITKLTGQEFKAIEATKTRADSIFEQIKRKQEAAEIDKPETTFEQDFQIEMEALTRFQSAKYTELEKYTNNEVILAEAKALQLREIADRTAAHEKELNELKIASQIQFFGDMAGISRDLIDAGLIRSKKAFKAYQAFAVAESTVSTYSAATKAYDEAMKGGGAYATVYAVAAAAAAIVKGLAIVAKISATQPMGYAGGGKIHGSSPTRTSDNIPINATAGEFMQPVKSVQYYGLEFMEGIRKRLIPKNLFNGFSTKLSDLRPKYSLATGGVVPNTQPTYGGVVVNLKNEGAPLTIESKKSSKDSRGQEVIDIVLSYTQSNKKNFKNSMRSMLAT